MSGTTKQIVSDEFMDRLNLAFGRTKPVSYDMIFVISPHTDNNHIIAVSDDLVESDFFDGLILEDGVSNEKTIPSECGLYSAKFIVSSHQCNHPQDPVEYDCDTWLEDIKLLHKIKDYDTK